MNLHNLIIREAREVYQVVIDYPITPEQAKAALQAMGELAYYGIDICPWIEQLNSKLREYKQMWGQTEC